MTYAVCLQNNMEEKIKLAITKYNADAIILLVDENTSNLDVFSKAISLFGKDLNLYVLEKNSDINKFCKNHLGYNDKYNIVML